MHLADDGVHVWNADLGLCDECLASLKMLLEPAELAHAARYRSVQHAQHYIAGRGMLRTILAQYVGIHPVDMRFDYTIHGKPFLIPDKGLAPVEFNVAHSGGVVVYAIARGRAVGIDIETVRHDIDHEQIAEQFFSTEERGPVRFCAMS